MLKKMIFEFTRDEENGLQEVNNMLRSVKFANMKLDDFNGYLQIEQSFNPDGTQKSVNYGYGFDSLTFICETSSNGDGKYYQLAAEVVPDTESGDQIFDRWREIYPKRRMRNQTIISFEDTGKNASIVLYWIAE